MSDRAVDTHRDDEYVDRVRLSESQWNSLLDRLDSNSGDDRRGAKRHPYRRASIPLVMRDEHDDEKRFLVCGRNLSSGGIAFLHGGFIHGGTRCEITLTRVDGRHVNISGVTIFCRYVERMLHEIGIRFESPIDPEAFLGADTTAIDEEHAAVPDVTGSARMLLVADNCFDIEDLIRESRQHGHAVVAVPYIGAGIDQVRRLDFDVLLYDLGQHDVQSDKVVPAFRRAGYTGPVFGLSFGQKDEVETRARREGMAGVFARPLDLELVGAVIDCIARERCIIDSPVHSTASNQSPAIIHAYLAQARKTVVRMRHALDESDAALLRELSGWLRQTASGYGFPSVLQAASNVLHDLDAGMPLAEMQSQFDTLINLCGRMRAAQLDMTTDDEAPKP